MKNEELIALKVKDNLIKAATTFRKDQKEAYRRAIEKEKESRARWVLETILENALFAEQKKIPLCDDTGIPHLVLEVGHGNNVSGEMLDLIHQGVAAGLSDLPGRPMAVQGNDLQRLEQSGGMSEDPAALAIAPVNIKVIEQPGVKLHILMQGGGPEIRSKTYRVYHQHNYSVVVDAIVNWAMQEVAQLGCTPSVLAVGIGRSHFEATSLMIESMIKGNFNIQSNIEQEITERINESKIGALGLGGSITALATFLQVGPQRASGVRIVSMRLCCCMEPRLSSLLL